MTSNEIMEAGNLPEAKEPTAELSAFLEVGGGENMGIFASTEAFTGAMQMAAALSKSTMIPKEYHGNVPNTIIAIDIAMRLKMPPLAVMQNLHIINGRPSWSSQFIITVINMSRRFQNPLQFHMDGEGDNMSCYAWAIDRAGARIQGTKITMKMAKDEGWYGKPGSKWKTIPEQMLKYRAAAFFGRAFCPDLIMGVYTADENKEMTSPVNAGSYETVAPDPFQGIGGIAPETAPEEPRRNQKAIDELEAPIDPPKTTGKVASKSKAQEDLEKAFMGE